MSKGDFNAQIAAHHVELFSLLLEYSWKGVPFPTTTCSLVLRHDLAQHKPGDTDGADIESTGQAPKQFTAHIPFRNGAVSSKGETWPAGFLYPTQYRRFMAVAEIGVTGVMVHPEHGPINCKLESVHVAWSAERRDGCDVEVVWLETLTADGRLAHLGSETSTTAKAQFASGDLDAQIRQMDPPPPSLPAFQSDFSSIIRSLASIADTVTMVSSGPEAKLDAIKYRLNKLGDSIDRAGETPIAGVATTIGRAVVKLVVPDTTANARKAMYWPMRQSIERMKSAAEDLKKSAGTGNKRIRFWVVVKDATLASIAQDIPADLTDLMRLNPKVVGEPIVPFATVLRYHSRVNAVTR